MKLAHREIVDVNIRDISSKKTKLYMTNLKMSSTELGGSTTYATGGAGAPKLVGFDSAREAKFSCEDALMSPESLALLLGDTVSTGVVYVPHTEVLTVAASNTGIITVTTGSTGAGNLTFTVNGSAKTVAVLVTESKLVVADKIKTAFDILGYTTSLNSAGTNPIITFRLASGTLSTLTFTDTGSTDAVATVSVNTTSLLASKTIYTGDLTTYPVSVFATTDGSVVGTELTSGSPSNATEYSIVTATFTVNSSYSAGDQFIVSYYAASSSSNKRVIAKTNVFPATFEITGKTLWRDEATGVDYPCFITIPKAKLLPGFSIQSKPDGDPATLKFEFECLKASGNYSLIIFDVDLDDAQ